MARLTLDQVHHVARLAALELTDEEAHALRDELGAILDYMATLDALDVSAVEPTFHPLRMVAALRADRLQPSLAREQALAAAPESDQGAFAVPKVLEGEG